MRTLLSFVIGLTLMLFFLINQEIISKAWSTDLPVPRKPSSQCVAPDVKPAPGQTMVQDDSCPNGLRWKFAK